MIEFSYAVHQMQRMKRLRDYPREEVDIQELAEALMSAESEAQSKAVTDDFVQYGNGYCPLPSEIREALARRSPNASRPLPAPTPDCPYCQGTGVITRRCGPYKIEYDFTCRCVLPGIAA